MEEEIAVVQLLQYGLPVTRSTSFAGFNSAALYELLTAALTQFFGTDGEEDQQQPPPSFEEAENATSRLRLLSILATRLQRAGCEFISPDHLMYPTEKTTRRILMWLIAELHRVTTANSVKDDVKWQQTPVAQAILSLHSVVQQHTPYVKKKNPKESIPPRESVIPAVPAFFFAVSAQERREGGVQPSLWQQFCRAYDAMQGFPHSSEEAPYQPQWREVLLNSFQEANAVVRTFENELKSNRATGPLMVRDASVVENCIKLTQASRKRYYEKKTTLASLHPLRAYAFAADVFYFNMSEDDISVQRTTNTTVTARETASEKADSHHDTLAKDDVYASQEKHDILHEYSEAKKEFRHLKKKLAELLAQKMGCDEEVEMLQASYGQTCSERERHKAEAERIAQALALLDTPEESEVQLERQVAELVEACENNRREVQMKLQKVEKKHIELLERLRVVGGDHEEQLLQLWQAVKNVQRQINEKERNVQQWQESVLLSNTTDIDISNFLSYIYEMTSNVCRQQAQIASIERETAAYNTRIEELEGRLRLSFFKQASELYQKAMVFDDGNVFQRIHKNLNEMRDGYRVLISATAKHGELTLESYRIEERLQNLRAEVEACDTEKVKTDLANLRVVKDSSSPYITDSGR
ncbi:hypothetical protein MOQ_001253 [Trypanosoma cruzi marinkellei]|uniref:Uncharacterized protein n=1 Tax=Trypanosoma cruzi marinkellei TaxID=85056 RepID=K2NLA0_TRYCR|nr:hypothetical protein MOQ_001253 [Trypanosoma cruzi marinkellei]